MKHRLGLISLLILAGSIAQAATITVSSSCNIVDAFRSAETDSAVGGCKAGNGPDIIVLEPGQTYTLTQPAGNLGGADTGLPVIYSKLTVLGNGATITRSAAVDTPPFRLLAVAAKAGDVTLDGITLRNGQVKGAASGGAIYNAGKLHLIRSTITGNTAQQGAGGIFLPPYTNANLVAVNATISGNSGIGLWAQDATVTLSNATIAFNSGVGMRAQFGKIAIDNTIIANNVAGQCQALNMDITDNANNISSDASCGFVKKSSLMNVDPLLLPLTDNGGLAFTHALGVGSPAIAAGSCSVAADERGAPRPGIGKSACDSGAYETGEAKVAVILPVEHTLVFNAVANGKAKLQEVTLQNVGNATVSAVKLSSDNAKFVVPLNLLNLSVGHQTHFNVAYDPKGVANDQGKLSIISSHANTIVLSVLGTGVADKEVKTQENDRSELTNEKVQSLVAKLKMMKPVNVNTCKLLATSPPLAVTLTEWVQQQAFIRLLDQRSQLAQLERQYDGNKRSC